MPNLIERTLTFEADGIELAYERAWVEGRHRYVYYQNRIVAEITRSWKRKRHHLTYCAVIDRTDRCSPVHDSVGEVLKWICRQIKENRH